MNYGGRIPQFDQHTGFILEDNVDLDFLNSLEQDCKYEEGIVKFVVNVKTRQVAVGMTLHRNGKRLFSSIDEKRIWGGNIQLNSGKVLYTSSINGESLNNQIEDLKFEMKSTMDPFKRSRLKKEINEIEENFDARLLQDRSAIRDVNNIISDWIYKIIIDEV